MYRANENRYDEMIYNRCGKSGLLLSAMSLGMWHNFGSSASYANMAEMVTTAFDLGITHFDLANNYGPDPGSAEENMGPDPAPGTSRLPGRADYFDQGGIRDVARPLWRSRIQKVSDGLA
jgi:Predicted oxidoreductases (related to aryl-alcohol dehydrogenases)